MSFDIEEYVSNYPGIMKKGPGNERILQECPVCGDRRGKIYVNVSTGAFICYSGRCGWKGRDFAHFVAAIENIEESAARMLMIRSVRPVMPSLEPIRGKEAEEDRKLIVEAPGLPEEYIPCFDKIKKQWNGIPKYLSNRGISKKAIKRYELGWCQHGKYRNRIIFPIQTNDLVSFQARATWEVSPKTPKYTGPSGAPHGRMLYGYNQVKGEKEIWLVEGAADVLATFQVGVPSVGLIGKKLSAGQARLLRALNPKKIHVMMDPDALKDAFDMVRSSGLQYVVNTVDIVMLNGGDPGELEPSDLKKQCYEFVPYSAVGMISRGY